jgi:dTMP kinase
MSGLFITFEGIDGVGKSTQADLLEKYLVSLGNQVVRTLEPGGTDLGHDIRQLLLHRKGHVAPRAEALLYAADRAHHVATKIRPALAEGKVVISDRYLDSSVAYQGAGRALTEEDVRHMSIWAVEGLLPKLTILLDLDAASARARRNNTGQEPDRLEQEKIEFFEATRQAFLAMASAEPERFLVIDANQTVEQMQAQIRARVNTLLG